VNKSKIGDIILVVISVFLLLVFAEAILAALQEGDWSILFIFSPFGVVGGALVFVVYYRRKNRPRASDPHFDT
jgi:hypothetical protein